jgi:hypothetical protein
VQLSEMNAITGAELQHIPRDTRGSAQNAYRMAYTECRLTSLGKNPQIPCSPTAAHTAALRAVRKWYPNFEPIVRLRA